jgi:hypothetical protein
MRALAGMMTVLFLANMLTLGYGQPTGTTVNLLVDQTAQFGTVTISFSGGNTIHVTYTIDAAHIADNWFLTEVHVDGPTLADIPVTGSGNPKVGKFTYSYELTPPTSNPDGTITGGLTTYTVAIPFAYQDTQDFAVQIAAHAALLQCTWRPPVDLTPGYWTYLDETGWGQGTQFPGSNWAMYITYTYDYIEP